MHHTENVGPRRRLPSVDRILREPDLRDVVARFEHGPVVEVARRVLRDAREIVERGGPVPDAGCLATRVQQIVLLCWDDVPARVINATGVVLHTNLGRAPLSRDAVRAMEEASGYSDLEIDLGSGRRDGRQRRVASMLTALTGAEAALVTGNNAGAMLLCLTALSAGREVIVSRGQEVEIGGAFRIPDILRQSGARLVEVGTTNRTRLSDYADAIGSDTAAILHVHSSNFRVLGFTASVSLAELSRLARERAIVLLDDNGSGSLLDTANFGLEHEPTPKESLDAGADVVTFSGDKLLGGPQSGIILGRSDLVERLATSPLARALRPDKLALAALAATLSTYLQGQGRTLPIWRMIGQSREVIRSRAQRWQERAAALGLPVELRDGESTIGGGSLPGSSLPTTLIALPAAVNAESLRTGRPAVLPITRDNRVLLDLRTVPEEDESALLQAVLAVSK